LLRLVEDPELQRRERRTPTPDLAPIVRRLQRGNVPIQRRPEVSVPVLNAAFTADFAFQNGAQNLVKALGLSRYEEHALEEASVLGSKGLLFVKHPGQMAPRASSSWWPRSTINSSTSASIACSATTRYDWSRPMSYRASPPRSSAKLTRRARIKSDGRLRMT
jgi:hypothetical protein